MFGLILGIAVLIAAIITWNVLRKSARYDGTMDVGRRRKTAKGILAGGIVLCVVLAGLGSVVSVPTGHTGVLTTFGKVENNVLEAGIHFKLPWQQVVRMDNRVQKATVNLSCFSSDIQEVECVYTLNYQINKSNAQEIYRRVGVQYYDTVITPNVAESVKTVTARYTAEELIGSRDSLAAAVEALLSEQLEKYNIEVVSTAIEDMDFTDAFTNAVEQKQVAAQNKLKAETEQAQKTMEKQAEAERNIIEANAAAEVAKVQADAEEYAGRKEAAKNEALAKSLSRELIDYLYVLGWDGKLPETYVGSDNVSTIVGMK